MVGVARDKEGVEIPVTELLVSAATVKKVKKHGEFKNCVGRLGQLHAGLLAPKGEALKKYVRKQGAKAGG